MEGLQARCKLWALGCFNHFDSVDNADSLLHLINRTNIVEYGVSEYQKSEYKTYWQFRIISKLIVDHYVMSTIITAKINTRSITEKISIKYSCNKSSATEFSALVTLSLHKLNSEHL